MIKDINYNKIFYYSILIFAFFLPLSRAIISFFIILIPIIWFIEGNLKQKLKLIGSNKLLVAISLYLSFSILSIIWSQDIIEALNTIRLHVYWLILFVIATSIKKEQIQPIITSFLAGMFLSEIIAYGVFFELWAFKDATVGNPSPVMFWIDYSVFMALTSILLLNRILSKNYSLQQKIFFFFFFCTVTGNLFLAIGRTGQVALVFTMFVLIFIHHKATIKSIILGLLVVGSIFTTAYNFSNSFQERSKAGVKDIQKIFKKDFNGSWGIRVVYWITAFDIVKANPLIGVGIGDSQSEIKKTLDAKNYQYINNSTKEFMQKLHPHNQYLLISIQLGIFGLLIFLYMIYCILSLKIQQLEIKILSILFTSIFFISCFAEPLFIKQFTIALFMLFVGLFTVASIEDKSKNVDC